MRHALTGAFNSIDSDKNDSSGLPKSNKESMSQSQVMVSEGK